MSKKQNPIIMEKLLSGFRMGLNDKDSCTIAGITQATLCNWKKNRQLLELIEIAKTENKAGLIQLILKAAKKNWTAAAWLLERKYPEEFGKREIASTSNVDMIADFVRNFRMRKKKKDKP